MKTNLLIIVLALLLALPAVAASEQRFTMTLVGHETVILPIPDGFVRVTSDSPVFRQVAKGAPNDLVALFLPKETWMRFAKGEEITLARYACLEMVKGSWNNPMSDESFANAMSSTKKQIEQTANWTFIADGKGYVIVSRLNDTDNESAWGGTVCFVHIQGRALYAYVYAPYSNKADLDWAVSLSKEWVPAVAAANPIPLDFVPEVANAPDTTPLHDAAEEGRVNDVARLLAAGDKVDARNSLGNTPLMVAARAGKTDVVRLLLSKGAQIDLRNIFRDDALCIAIDQEHVDIVTLLLSKGAEVNGRDDQMNTPLHLACECGNLEIVKRLVAAEARINAMNADGETPLFCAARNDGPDVAEYLISKGGDVAAVRNDGYTALHAAVERNKTETAALLMKHGLKEDIFIAAGLGHVEKVQELLKANPKLVNTVLGWAAPLEWAVSNGHRDVVETLIKAGADVNGDEDNYPVLITAAAVGNKEVVALLLAAGAKIDVSDDSSQTPLILALSEGHPEVAEMLIEKGADVNYAGMYGGTTPLAWAAREGYLALVKTMLEKGAKIEEGEYGPLKRAEEQGHKDVVELLKQHGAR